MRTVEDSLHEAVIRYIRVQYPSVLWMHPPNEGKRSRWEAARAKRMGLTKGWPDILIFEPREKIVGSMRQQCPGLAIELKAEGKGPYRKDGKLKAGDHLEAQAQKLRELRARGWIADFAVGFDQARQMIDNYFRDEPYG